MAKNVVIGYGNVGRLLVQELQTAGEAVTVARHQAGSQVDGVESVTVDILDQASVQAALSGANRVFVTTGLPYKLAVWQQQWPVIVQNVIAACKASGAQLVFLDNLYLYGPAPLQSPITEGHPRQPSSKKGQVRLSLVQMLESAMSEGVSVLIVRCPDFYGPNVNSSSLTMAIDAAVSGKPAYYLGNPATMHTYAYVPDIAKATVRLALASDTYGQTWHVPSAGAIKGDQIMSLLAEHLGTSPKWSVLRPGLKLKLLGLVVPILGELAEMMYQFESDYIFDSSKFMAKFPDFVVTSYDEGVKTTVDASRAAAASSRP